MSAPVSGSVVSLYIYSGQRVPLKLYRKTSTNFVLNRLNRQC